MAAAGAREARGARVTADRATASSGGVRNVIRESAVTAWRHRHDPHAQWLAALTVVFVAAAAAFGHVVEDYLTGDPIVLWDVEFARWLHEHSSPALVRVFEVVTLAGNAIFLGLLTMVALVVLARRRDLDQVVLLIAVAGGIEVLNALLKLLFHRPRPELAFVHLDTYSFPSGHAAGSAAIYSVLAVLVARGSGCEAASSSASARPRWCTSASAGSTRRALPSECWRPRTRTRVERRLAARLRARG